MKKLTPGTHWKLGGTCYVVDRYERTWDSVHVVSEDGNARVFPSPYWTQNCTAATEADLGLRADNPNPTR